MQPPLLELLTLPEPCLILTSLHLTGVALRMTTEQLLEWLVLDYSASSVAVEEGLAGYILHWMGLDVVCMFCYI